MNLTNSPKHVEAALRYAAADKSDPFAFNRAMTHLKLGLGNSRGADEPDYDAEPAKETRRTPLGEYYEATVYHKVRRI